MSSEAQQELSDLGKTIRKYRKELGVSQEDFAELCDLHRTYIGHVERGEVNVSFKNILRMAKALKVKPSTLFESAKL